MCTLCYCVSMKENAYYLSLFAYRTWSSNSSVCHAISRFGRHRGLAWHILPRSHVFSFSHPGAGIYFVTLVRRWNVGDFLFTTGLVIVFILAKRAAEDRERSEFIISSRAKRACITWTDAKCDAPIGPWINKSFFLWIYAWCHPMTSCSATSCSILRFQAT